MTHYNTNCIDFRNECCNFKISIPKTIQNHIKSVFQPSNKITEHNEISLQFLFGGTFITH